MRPLNRITPGAPPAAFKTYALLAPADTHYRAATCEEVDCRAWRYGWRLKKQDLEPADLHLVKVSGRRYRELHESERVTWLVFEAGQACFAAPTHRVPLEREPIYLVHGGDWRGNPLREEFRHTTPASWVDDFATHQDKIATVRQRG